MANIEGTSNNDTIIPGFVSVGVYGGVPSDASDYIYGYGGNDIINGSGGNDTIIGGDGDDTIDGGDGDDLICSGEFGEESKNPFLYPGNDNISGGNGNDTIYVSTGFASLSGGAGYDKVYIYGAGSTLNLATSGIEYISGSSGNDIFDGTNQTVALTLYGNGGDDVLRGSSYNDHIYGGGKNDTIYAGIGADSVDGGYGDDTIYVSTEFSSLSGGSGYDKVYLSGSTGNTLKLNSSLIEYISGGSGNDNFDGSSRGIPLTMFGNGGDDALRGGSGSDSIDGGDGDDTIYINTGFTSLNGGSGYDKVYIDGKQGNTLNMGTMGIEYISGGSGTRSQDRRRDSCRNPDQPPGHRSLSWRRLRIRELPCCSKSKICASTTAMSKLCTASTSK